MNLIFKCYYLYVIMLTCTETLNRQYLPTFTLLMFIADSDIIIIIMFSNFNLLMRDPLTSNHYLAKHAVYLEKKK